MTAPVAPTSTPLLRTIICLVVFEAAWFACVIGAARGQMVWGLAAVSASIALQLAISRKLRADLLLMAVALGCGLVWDTMLSRTHLVVYASHWPFLAIAPIWILALWAQLATVLREPLRWLHGRPVLAVALSAVGGAASYAGAGRLGACTFPEPGLALVVLAAGWGIMLPLLLQLARRLERSSS